MGFKGTETIVYQTPGDGRYGIGGRRGKRYVTPLPITRKKA